MRQMVMLAVLVGLTGLAVAGCCNNKKKSEATHTAAAQQQCLCEQGKAGQNVWCQACGVGYVDGKKVACKGCFLAKTGGPACPTCSAK